MPKIFSFAGKDECDVVLAVRENDGLLSTELTIDGKVIARDRISCLAARLEGDKLDEAVELVRLDRCNPYGAPAAFAFPKAGIPPNMMVYSAMDAEAKPVEAARELLHDGVDVEVLERALQTIDEIGHRLLSRSDGYGLRDVFMDVAQAANGAAEAFRSSNFVQLRGGKLRRLKKAIQTVARTFGPEFEYLGFPQIDHGTSGNASVVADKCARIERLSRSLGLSLVFNGGQEYRKNVKRIRQARALEIIDTEILPAAAVRWRQRVEFLHARKKIEVPEKVVVDLPPAQTDQVTSGQIGAVARKVIEAVRGRLGETIAATIETVLKNGRTTLSDERIEDAVMALEFLRGRQPDLENAIDAVTNAMLEAATPSRRIVAAA